MIEIKKFIGGLRKRGEEKSEDTKYLLDPENIERLVSEGRTPVCIGRVGKRGEEMKPYYQIPPCTPDEIESVYHGAGGARVYVTKEGAQKIGPTYTLTPEQAIRLEEEILSAKDDITS